MIMILSRHEHGMWHRRTKFIHAHQTSMSYLSSRPSYVLLSVSDKYVRHIGILLPFSILTCSSSSLAWYFASANQISSESVNQRVQDGSHRIKNLLSASVFVTALIKKYRNLFAHQISVSDDWYPPYWNSTFGFEYDLSLWHFCRLIKFHPNRSS